MAKLTDTQLVILNTAAKRDSRLLLPFSRTLKINKGPLTSVIKSLIAKDLIEERAATKDEKEWRTDDEVRYSLVITDAGLQALGIETEHPAAETAANPKPSVTTAKGAPSDAKPKKGGKLDGVLTLVRRAGGATIADLQASTGWQPHSVRAALTGFRKQGIEITRSKNGDGVTKYTSAPA